MPATVAYETANRLYYSTGITSSFVHCLCVSFIEGLFWLMSLLKERRKIIQKQNNLASLKLRHAVEIMHAHQKQSPYFLSNCYVLFFFRTNRFLCSYERWLIRCIRIYHLKVNLVTSNIFVACCSNQISKCL